MDVLTGVFTYFLIWWTMLFVVLPQNIERSDKPKKGHDRGAPKTADLKRKFLMNTVLSAGIWIVIYIITLVFGFDIEEYFREAIKI